MTAQIILQEKLRRPDVAALARPRLEVPLRNAAPGEVILVVAPPGSGKTTLLARVCVDTVTTHAWYRVTAEDATEEAFTGYLAHTLDVALGLGAPDVRRMDQLLKALENWSGDAVVVLDDVHEIAGSPAEAALAQFISLRPPGLRVAMGSRRVPELQHPTAPRLRFPARGHQRRPAVPVMGGGGALRRTVPRTARARGRGRADPPDRRVGGRTAALPSEHKESEPPRTRPGRRRSRRSLQAGALVPGPQCARGTAPGAPPVSLAHQYSRGPHRSPVRRAARYDRQRKDSRRT